MIRWFLLGGRWPAVPWEVLLVLGGAALGAGGAFVLLFPLWRSYPVLGYLEVGIYLAVGVGLVVAALVRRGRGAHEPPARP